MITEAVEEFSKERMNKVRNLENGRVKEEKIETMTRGLLVSIPHFGMSLSRRQKLPYAHGIGGL